MTASQEWRAHWRVVAGASLAFATGYAAFGLVSSLFITELSKEFGWSRGQISSISAIGLLGAISAPFIGRLADRFGLRPVALVCMAMLAVVYVGLSRMQGELWMLVALIGVFALFGVGTGGLTMTRAINSWFSASRGLALSVTLAGVPLAGMFLPPLLNAVMQTWSWREAYLLLGAMTVFIGIPAIAFLVHERHDRPRPVEAKATAYPGQKIDQVRRNPQFWWLALAIVGMNIPGPGIVAQLAPMLTDKGLSQTEAALLLSVMAGAILFGRLLSGWLLDRLSPALVAMAFTAIPALGCLLLLSGLVQAFPAAALAVMLIGVQQGAEVDVIGYFTARHFGMRRYSSIYGALLTISLLSTAVGVVSFGLGHDRFGNYDLVLAVSVVMFLGSAACFLGLRKAPVVD